MCFQNIQTVSNFFLSQTGFSGVLSIYASFSFGCHTDWRESWQNIMAVFRVGDGCI